MSPAASRRLVLDTITGPHTLDALYSYLNAVWVDHSEVAEDIKTDIAVAAFEICTNIIEYAGTREPVRLQVRTRMTPDRFEIVFTDDGRPARIDLDAVSFPEESAERGRGLPLAKALLDDLEYRRDQGQNVWLLTRRLRE